MSAHATSTTTSIQVRPVRGRRDRAAFMELPHQLHGESAYWVPPLRSEQRALLDRRRNPFFEVGDVELFLAHRDGRPVGRIAAVSNPPFNSFHESRCGFFGLFECRDDVGVAHELLTVASSWLRQRGSHTALGPVNFSTNDECGVLVKGFAEPPSFMMPYNPAYYPELIEACGFDKAADMFAWRLEVPAELPPRLAALDRSIRNRDDIVVRQLDLKRFEGETELLRTLYNAAWSGNWGFVPMTRNEFRSAATKLKRIIDPGMALIAELDGQPASFIVSVPDINGALRHTNGRLWTYGLPIGLLALRRELGTATTVRTMLFGTLPGYRGLGLEAALLLASLRRGRHRGYERAECSWTLETNDRVNQLLTFVGARRSKRYRLYQAEL